MKKVTVRVSFVSRSDGCWIFIPKPESDTTFSSPYWYLDLVLNSCVDFHPVGRGK